MRVDRLPASAATLYAKLLERSLLNVRVVGIEGQPPGGLAARSSARRRMLGELHRLDVDHREWAA